MLPPAYISHRTPVRLRIKMYSKKGDAGYFDAVKKKFSGVKGIEGVEANPLTGSILIIHNDLAPDIIGQFAQANDLFSLALSDSSPSGLQQRVSATFKSLNKQLKTTTQGELDIAGLSFLVLAGAGIYEISRGNFVAPAWYTAFWYALNIFLKSSKGVEAG